MVLSATLVFIPIPLSNVVPTLVIALISLAYLEEDGVLLSIALLAAVIHLCWRLRRRQSGRWLSAQNGSPISGIELCQEVRFGWAFTRCRLLTAANNTRAASVREPFEAATISSSPASLDPTTTETGP